jgi:hypothetical protein
MVPAPGSLSKWVGRGARICILTSSQGHHCYWPFRTIYNRTSFWVCANTRKQCSAVISVLGGWLQGAFFFFYHLSFCLIIFSNLPAISMTNSYNQSKIFKYLVLEASLWELAGPCLPPLPTPWLSSFLLAYVEVTLSPHLVLQQAVQALPQHAFPHPLEARGSSQSMEHHSVPVTSQSRALAQVHILPLPGCCLVPFTGSGVT